MPIFASSLPVADSTAVVKGSGDATKLGRFEVDTNVGAGTTVALTFPATVGEIIVGAGPQTIAGTKTFTGPQEFNDNLAWTGWWSLGITGLSCIQITDRDAQFRLSAQANEGLDFGPGTNLGIRWRTGNYAGTVHTRLYPSATSTLTLDDGAGGAANLAVTGSIRVGGGTAVTQILSATAVLDFGNTNAQLSADLTITVTGAAVGDVVCIATPAAADANTNFTGFVSAADTVTIRFSNFSAGAVNPASGTYRATIIKH